MLRRKIKYKIFKVALSTLCLTMITLLASGSFETYAHLTTLARSQTGVAASAKSSDILKFEGTFNEDIWQGSGGSGIKITNLSTARIWVFFEVTGSVRDIVRPIHPVGLEPNQTYEVPLEIADAGDMGMLQWQNQGKAFSGEIIARVLNNFASYRIGKVDIRADKLFDKLSTEKVKPGDEIRNIKGISDILKLIAEKNKLLEKMAQLMDEINRLQAANMAIQNENMSLRKSLDEANKKLTDTNSPANTTGGNNNTPVSTGTAGGENKGSTDGKSAAESVKPGSNNTINPGGSKTSTGGNNGTAGNSSGAPNGNNGTGKK
ncbi:MAG: hypothetical protein ACOY30_04875 [Bacillota bacterium]